MKTLALGLLALALLLLVIPPVLADRDVPVRFGDPVQEDEDEGGGSKFDDPEDEAEEEEGEKIPEKPVPATYPLKDYRLEMLTKDGRFWKRDVNYTEEEEKANIILKLRMKLPKSESHFDVIIQGQGWEHKSGFKFDDGKQIGASNFKALSERFFENDQKSWKELRDVQKPKKVGLSRDTGKVYTYSFIGLSPGGSMPLKKTSYMFKFKDKTYSLVVLMTTTSAKNKKIVKAVDEMLRSIRERKKKK